MKLETKIRTNQELGLSPCSHLLTKQYTDTNRRIGFSYFMCHLLNRIVDPVARSI